MISIRLIAASMLLVSPAASAAGSVSAMPKQSSQDALTSKRKAAYSLFVKNFESLKAPCGRAFSEGKIRQVFFPIGQSQLFYTQDFGIHMAIRVVNGNPIRLWCMSEAEGRTILRPQDHSGTYWKIAVNSEMHGKQLGNFPDLKVQLDGYSAFAQMAQTFRLNTEAKAICSRGPNEVFGLNYPRITNPCI